MDIARDPPKSLKKYLVASMIVVALALVTFGATRLRPAVVTMERSVITFDTVAIGDMVRDVHAPGSLVAEHTRIIVATTGGRVESLLSRPGDSVAAGGTIVVLSNADVALAALQVQQQLTQALSGLAQLRSSLQQQRVSQLGLVAQLHTQELEATRTARVFDTLDKRRLASSNEVAAARDKAKEIELRYQLESARAADMKVAEAEQIRLEEDGIDGLRKIVQEQRGRVASLRVTAGEAGQLQSLGNPTLELGQWVNSGIELARVSQPGRLKAVLRVPETQARDIVRGLSASIDTHDGVVSGHVATIDPVSHGGSVTVEIALDGPLPRGARVDLSVDGAIEIDRLRRVLHVGRPAYGFAETVVKLFKVVPNTGEAVRVDVALGKATVNNVELKGGLSRGDSVIISDMAQMLTETRIRIR
ncbi:MAG: HlyD family efflux transporter periplasmic adaptor subunit [bacterium]